MAEEIVEEKEKYDIKDIEIYRPIASAPEFFEKFIKEKDIGPLEKVILKLFENLGIKEERYRERLKKSIYATSPQGIDGFIKDNLRNYQEAKRNAKLRDLRGLYSKSFEEFYTKENLPKVNKDFDSDKTYGDFIKEYEKVREIVQSETVNFTKEQREQAEKELEELNKIAEPLEQFEIKEIEKIKGPVSDDSLKKRLNARYEEKKPKEGEEKERRE